MNYAAYSVTVPVLPYVLMLIAALGACVLVLAAFALEDSDADLPLPRLYRRLRLAVSRLGNVLERRGIPAARYLAAVPVAEQRRQLAACRDCSQRVACDANYQRGSWGRRSFPFCPNREAIDRYLA